MQPTCSVADCGYPARCRGLCHTHYARQRDGRPLDSPIARRRPRPFVACKIEGCEGVAKAYGWCNSHYQRWYRTGDPGSADSPRYGLIKVCSAEGCEREHRTKGWCDLHYRRIRRGVDPTSKKFLAAPPTQNPNSYAALHARISAVRGSASTYDCACGAPATGWAYQHNDPSALVSALGHFYSLRIHECYAPMCTSCHNLLDRDPDEQERRALT